MTRTSLNHPPVPPSCKKFIKVPIPPLGPLASAPWDFGEMDVDSATRSLAFSNSLREVGR